ncbi:MAG: hypothetical protein M1323_05525 [Candidatus Thermoplasmatota archaeon]|nr:hypothetical protein [Candidatus Thermoplasmatota archaeon]
MLFLSDEVANIIKHNHSDLNFSFNGDKFPHISTFGDQILESERTDYNRIFKLVKKSVKNILGKERTGLGLALSNLPNTIGAYWQLGGNYIVLNETIVGYMRSATQSTKEFNSFLFTVLAHEYIHSVGYVDEMEARRMTAFVTKMTFGEDHIAARIGASDLWHLYPSLLLLPSGDGSKMKIVNNFDSDATSYIT